LTSSGALRPSCAHPRWARASPLLLGIASAACFGVKLARDHLASLACVRCTPAACGCMHLAGAGAPIRSGRLLLGAPTQRAKRLVPSPCAVLHPAVQSHRRRRASRSLASRRALDALIAIIPSGSRQVYCRYSFGPSARLLPLFLRALDAFIISIPSGSRRVRG
jgi:hypothetical protein